MGCCWSSRFPIGHPYLTPSTSRMTNPFRHFAPHGDASACRALAASDTPKSPSGGAIVSVRGCAVEVNVDGDYKSCSGAVMLPLIGSLRRIDPTVVPLHRESFPNFDRSPVLSNTSCSRRYSTFNLQLAQLFRLIRLDRSYTKPVSTSRPTRARRRSMRSRLAPPVPFFNRILTTSPPISCAK